MLNNKRKIVFILEAPRTVRNFFASGALAEVSNHYIVEIWHARGIKTPEMDQYSCFELPNLSGIFLKINSLLHHCLLWQNRERNMLMKLRALNQFGRKSQREKWKSVINYEIKEWGEIKRAIVRWVSYKIPLSIIRILRKYVMNREIKIKENLLFSDKEIELVLLPYGGNLSVYFDFIVYYTRKKRILSLALQENWDNLCTKSFLIETPSGFGTWGEQSTSHLHIYQDVNISNIFELGSPRFSSYGDLMASPQKKFHDSFSLLGPSAPLFRSDSKYVVVGGTGDGIDDELILGAAITTLKKLNRLEDIKIIFRPHPSTRTKHNFEKIWEFSGDILIDCPQTGEDVHKIAKLIKGSEAVICNFSTLALEALLLNRPTILPLFTGVPSAKWGYDRLINEAPHFIGIRVLADVYAPRNQEEFDDSLLHLLSNRRTALENRGLNLNWYCQQGNYAPNLNNAVNQLLNGVATKNWVK